MEIRSEYVELKVSGGTTMQAWTSRPTDGGSSPDCSSSSKPLQAGKDFINVEFSDAEHGFFCDQRGSYNPIAAAEAWPLTLAFCAFTLLRRPPPPGESRVARIT